MDAFSLPILNGIKQKLLKKANYLDIYLNLRKEKYRRLHMDWLITSVGTPFLRFGTLYFAEDYRDGKNGVSGALCTVQDCLTLNDRSF